MSTSRKSQLLLAVGGVTIVLLLAAVFTLGSLTLPSNFEPLDQAVLYALSTFIVAALLVFASILTRSVVRLGAERRRAQPGSRFKTKMVLGAIAVSFLPVVFLFFVSYALLNRTLVLWFPRPLEIATEYSRELVDEMSARRRRANVRHRQGSGRSHGGRYARDTIHAFDQAFARGADLAWEVDENGQPIAVAANSNFQRQIARCGLPAANSRLELPTLVSQMPGGAELWQYGGKYLPRGPRQGGRFHFWPEETFRTIIRTASGISMRKRRPMASSASTCAPTKSQLLLTL